ncbi:uncharacterized protein K460DRAFT_351329 [Cucurbitaria berberidis CBS 394.84]|uniref:MYND-type domain-containing protein n=1 Tax=Cucurbitaria berberidis CBS 394.84 TaxID=1168544 RepID=A0A9P4GRJ1_9PLEO|nr:uncharacterized protein K460DRAFT_351329 [Cucurbitaria berberidis CBS 394.84]KAF1851403.1 hypothetical protein K460DRAFT_351329 [Cucurbitaria berberidis CBS 394.84]
MAGAPQDFGQPYVLEDFLPVEQPTTSTLLCAMCHKESSRQRCSGCKNVKYCSTDCQSSHWATHKLLCKAFVDTQDTRPSPKSRRALYFPTDVARPRFIWLEYNIDGAPLDMQKCFPTTPKEEIKTIGFYDRYLPYWIQLSYDSNLHSQRILSKNMSIGHAFRGPVVALAYDPESGLGKPALDVDTTILGALREYAKLREEYHGPIFVEQPQHRYSDEEWKKIVRP